MSPLFFTLERPRQVTQWINPVDDWLEFRCLNRSHHFHLLLPAPNDKALKFLVPAHKHCGGNCASNASKHANQRDVTSNPTGSDRLWQSPRAADFDDMVDTAPTRYFPHHFSHVFMLLVVNGVVCP